MGKKNRMVGLVFPFFQSTTKRFCGDSVVQLIAKVLCVDRLRLPDRVYSFFPNNTRSKVQKKTTNHPQKLIKMAGWLERVHLLPWIRRILNSTNSFFPLFWKVFTQIKAVGFSAPSPTKTAKSGLDLKQHTQPWLSSFSAGCMCNMLLVLNRVK